MYQVLDLFSGIGGFSLGLERTGGFKTVAFCEIEPFCKKVLNKHWPDVPIYDDIKGLTYETLQRDGITPDVLCGGFPCQDISTAGKGAGIDGERSGLWSEYARLVGEIRPRYVIVENVAALLGRGIGRVLGDLAAIRYDAEWSCIPGCAVGAPHERDRLWIVAYPTEERFTEAGSLRHLQRSQWIPGSGEEDISTNAWQERTQRYFPKTVQKQPAFSWCEDVRRVEDLRDRPDLPPPLFCGARDGIPDWVDRVGTPGNAVIPQIPELIGNAILEAA